MIRILHHHLRRGGVTRVMRSTACILRDAGEEVDLWSGEASPEPMPEGIGLQLVPELGYGSTFSEPDCGRLVQQIREAHQEGDIWHIHNHSLGKNPVVTEAVRRLAEWGLPMVLQIHDFAEDGRPLNLNLLRETLSEGLRTLYPFGDHVMIAVLQERDRQVLAGAGIPEDRLAVLPNPISSEDKVTPPQGSPKRLLYLTRAIRRKNVGEFVYWAKGLSGQLTFATSLTPENPKEKVYFDPWVTFAREQGVEIQWGVGMSGKPFADVVGECDACITTSVGEGFGMSFLEPYAMDRPVVGRDLPEITAGFKQDGVILDQLYARLPVSVGEVDAGFWERAVVAVNRWRKDMGVEGHVGGDELRNAWGKDGEIDFGRLDEAAQRSVIAARPLGGLAAEVLCGQATGKVVPNRETVLSVFDADSTLKRVRDVYQKIGVSNGCAYADAERVRDAFTDLKTLSMLRL